ncbi:hypothetical protein N7495_007656 [Penicillium taxi]|uniref:uncharacterized protein n=1 Tax=Penicillium taxi TaxID=168475 RepID=UPI00254570AC|nr:uncharacterized protein N7495_007656 [Penicillium taxi]KAJ5887615.1 hypothetical protein N7495_007656 [Penicillium taxi]
MTITKSINAFLFFLPFWSTAAPIPDDVSNPAFSVMAIHSASPIHYMQMNAQGLKLWLGGQTSSYCPDMITDCPAGTRTVFSPGGNSLCTDRKQDVEVPGGQQVYVTSSGALSFTQAHSASIPEGSHIGGFAYEPGKPWAHYVYNGWNTTGLMACPTEDKRWQVFSAAQNATVPLGNVNDCLSFSTIALTYDGVVPAWQYI